ncbi:hypothetical protein BDW72DRAFT_175600, partial [Aspergillus terricola var. indicus]
ESLSDLLDTHQVRPTEVKTPRQGQDHHHSLDQRQLGTSPPKRFVPEDKVETGVNTASL